MKREWTYLAALLPFTTAMSSSAAFGARLEDWTNDAVRAKKGQQEEADGSGEGEGGDGKNGAGVGPEVQTPGDPSALDGEGSNYGLFGPGPDGPHSPMMTPLEAEGMYAPAGGASGGSSALSSFGGGGGGGGGGSVVMTTKILNGSVSSQNPVHPNGPSHSPDGPSHEDPDGNGGIVESDPADADAMMILLGGLAEGTGAGAESSGEIVFDIVDYGMITFGYGYATFMASGSDGAFADTFFDVTGADLVFSYDTGYSLGTSAFSTTHVFAIDFEDESMFGEQHLAAYNWMELLSEGPFGQNILGDEQDVSVDGNVAMMSVSGEVVDDSWPVVGHGVSLAFDSIGSVVMTWLKSEQASLSVGGEAEGIDTLASATGSLLEIEDQFSSVSGSAIGVA